MELTNICEDYSGARKSALNLFPKRFEFKIRKIELGTVLRNNFKYFQ